MVLKNTINVNHNSKQSNTAKKKYISPENKTQQKFLKGWYYCFPPISTNEKHEYCQIKIKCLNKVSKIHGNNR